MESAGARNLDEANKSQSSALVPLSPQISSSSQLQPLEYREPLTDLHRVLVGGLVKTAKAFQVSLKQARGLAYPWLDWNSHPEQDALKVLVTHVDPHGELDSTLTSWIKDILSFDKECHQALIAFYAEADKPTSVVAHKTLATANQQIRKNFNSECAEYKKLMDDLLSYGQHVHEIELSGSWVSDDIKSVHAWEENATAVNDSLSNLQAEIKQVLEQNGLGLGVELSDVTERLDNHVDLAAHQKLQQAVSDIVLKINALISVKQDEVTIDLVHKKMQALNRIFAADTDYQQLALAASSLETSTNSLDVNIKDYLKDFNQKEQLNQTDILALLQRFLDPGMHENIDDQIKALLATRGQDATFHQRNLEDFQLQVQQKLKEVRDVKSELLSLDSNNIKQVESVLAQQGEQRQFDSIFLPNIDRMVIVSSQPNARLNSLRRLKEKLLNVGAIELSRDELTRQHDELKAVERGLLSLASDLKQAQEDDHKTLVALLQYILADKQACQLDNCEVALKACVVKINDGIIHVNDMLAKFASIGLQIDKCLSAFNNEVIKFKDASHAMNGVGTRCTDLKKEKVNEDILDNLLAIRNKWRAITSDKALYGKQMLLAGLPVTKDVFNKKLKELLDKLSSVRTIDFAKVPRSPVAGEIYTAIATSYNALRDSLREARRLVRNLSRTGVDEDELFDRVTGHLFEKLSSNDQSEFAKRVDEFAEAFRGYFADVNWGEKSLCSDEKLKVLLATPEKLLGMLDELNALGDHLSNSAIIEALEQKKSHIEAVLPKLANRKDALDIMKHNVETFLQSNSRYNELSLSRNKSSATVQKISKALADKISSTERLKALDVKSLLLVEKTIQAMESINLLRKQAYTAIGFAESVMNRCANHVGDALLKIKAEEKFKKDILSLYKDIAVVKQREQAIRVQSGELFQRLKREFLFNGKSREIISRLEAHKQQNHAQTHKGKLIGDFLQGLFDPNKAQDLKTLVEYFDRPFGGNNVNNRALFATGNVFGLASTTERLIGELQEELMRIVARERVAGEGSIAQTIQKDCDEIRNEYNDIIVKKDLERKSVSAAIVPECDVLIARALAIPRSSPGAVKLHQDIIELQRWSGKDGALACRLARIQCAIAIRQNNVADMNALFNKYKFSYSYQALRYHLEKVTTNRTDKLSELWQRMDEIASDSGDEDAKYTLMREEMLDYFNYLRLDDSYSVSGFFGRVSRLTKATEQFLVIGANDRGLGYVVGEAEGEVHHVEETRFYALSCFGPR